MNLDAWERRIDLAMHALLFVVFSPVLLIGVIMAVIGWAIEIVGSVLVGAAYELRAWWASR